MSEDVKMNENATAEKTTAETATASAAGCPEGRATRTEVREPEAEGQDAVLDAAAQANAATTVENGALDGAIWNPNNAVGSLHLGIDVGSTTVKLAVLNDENRIVYAKYQRHHTDVRACARDLFVGAPACCPRLR